MVTLSVPLQSSVTLRENWGLKGDAHAGEDGHRQVSLLAGESIDGVKEVLTVNLLYIDTEVISPLNPRHYSSSVVRLPIVRLFVCSVFS